MTLTGLTSKEAAELKAQGKSNKVEMKVSRTYTEIIVKNFITPFNLMIFGLGVILLILEEPMNAFSACAFILLNVIIASLQEIRAKRRLDKIALLLRPKATVLRDGQEKVVDQKDIVLGDIVILTPGEQAQVDGEILEAEYLEMDEALLTGESRSVKKRKGDRVFSGSYCITGKGYYKVDTFGEDSTAFKMVSTARKYKNKYTPLQMETTSVVRLLIITSFIFLVLMIVINLIKYSGSLSSISATVNNAVIVFDIVPMALPLFVTIAYMVAAVRMMNKGVLLQRSNAVESLGHVNVVCMDKTGTITTNNLIFAESQPFSDEEQELMKAFLGSTGSLNKTTKALTDNYGKTEIKALDEIRFSSDRKYSAVKVELNGENITLFLGAPSALGKYISKDLSEFEKKYSDKGLRTLVFAKGADIELFSNDRYNIPQLEAISFIGLRDEIRENCRETIQTFLDNDMEIKVISGDDPNTINSIFTIADIPGERKIISGEQLAVLSGKEKEDAIMNCNIFGRMRPEQKEDVISTLKHNGKYVAMVGDGVNDVSSLKAANVGIALQSGAGAARGSAEMVLVNDDFGALPKTLVEGKRTLTGMKDALKIFLTKNVTIAFLVLFITIIFSTILAHGAIPLLPTQQLVYATLSVSITAFFVIVWSEPVNGDKSVIPSVMRYVIPTSLIAGVIAVMIYGLFYGLTMSNVLTIDVTQDYLVKYGWPNFKSLEDMLTYYGVSSIDQIPLDRYAEINARCALVMFVIFEGISQMLMILPHWKFLSLDGVVRKDIRPTLLAIFMIGLTLVIYMLSVNGYLTWLFPMVNFPIEGFVAIVIAVVLWFVINFNVIKHNRLNFISNMFSRAYGKTLQREFVKNKKDDGES